MPKRSAAVTVKLKAVPEVAVAGAERINREVGPGVTRIEVLPVMEEFVVSVAVTVCEPAAFSAITGCAIPFIKVTGLVRKTGAESELVSPAMPLYPVAGLLLASSAVMFIWKRT